MSHLTPERIEELASSSGADAHLTSCAECKKSVGSARARRMLLKGLKDVTLTEAAFRRVEAKLGSEVHAPVSAWGLLFAQLRSSWVLGVAAVALVAVVVVPRVLEPTVKRGFVQARVAPVFAKHFFRDVGTIAPPIDDKDANFLVFGNFCRDGLQHRRLPAAVSIDDDDVAKLVFHQAFEQLFDERAIRFFRNRKRAGIGFHAARDAIWQRRRNHRIDAFGNVFGQPKRGGVVCAIVHHAMRFHRAGRQQHGVNFGGYDFFEFHPIDALHLARRNDVGGLSGVGRILG